MATKFPTALKFYTLADYAAVAAVSFGALDAAARVHNTTSSRRLLASVSLARLWPRLPSIVQDNVVVAAGMDDGVARLSDLSWQMLGRGLIGDTAGCGPVTGFLDTLALLKRVPDAESVLAVFQITD